MTYVLDRVALRSARRSKGLTQSQLGLAVEVAGASRVSAWELGHERPHPHQLRRLAEVLEMPITSLLQPVDEEQRGLRRLRIEAGLSVGELANQIHVAAPTLKRWECGMVIGLAARAPVDDLAAALAVDTAVVRVALRRAAHG